MYFNRRDMDILMAEDTIRLKQEYIKRFGIQFICFDYVNFHGTKDIPAAKFWKDELEKCLRENHPTDIIPREPSDW